MTDELVAGSKDLNRLLLRHGRKPLAEIERLTGIPAAEAGERLVSLLANPDWRDDLMEEKLLLEETAMLIDDIRDKMAGFGVDDEGWASMARVQLQAIKTVLEQLDKRRKSVNGDLKLVTEKQAELMAMAFELAMEKSVFELQKRYPDVEEVELRSVFKDSLELAVIELDGKTS